MKKLWILSVIAFSVLMACSKEDDDDDKPKTNNELILGTWTSVKLENYTINNDNNDTTFYFVIPGSFMKLNFEANGAVTTTAFGDTATGTYTINGNNFFMVSEGDTISGEITTLNTTKLVVENQNSYMENSVSFTDYEYLEFTK